MNTKQNMMAHTHSLRLFSGSGTGSHMIVSGTTGSAAKKILSLLLSSDEIDEIPKKNGGRSAPAVMSS
jgi:hypothetical protein